MNFNIYNRNCSIRKSKLIVIYLRNESQEHAHFNESFQKYLFFYCSCNGSIFLYFKYSFFVRYFFKCKALYGQYFMQFCPAILLRCKLKKKNR